MGQEYLGTPRSAHFAAQAAEAERPLFGALEAHSPALIGHNGGPPIDTWATDRSQALAGYAKSRTAMEALALDGLPLDLVDDPANPKDRMGALKLPSLSTIPSSLLLSLGGVMRLGAAKYGRFNWRKKPVKATVYADAAMRHLMSWMDGEDTDPESGESHLGHVAACMGIVLDAKARGVLVDDRDVHESTLGTAAEIIRARTLSAA